MQQPTLRTQRLILRPFAATDLNDIFAYASDQKITEHLTWNAHKSTLDSQDFLDFVKSQTCETPGRLNYTFAVEIAAEKKVIGSISFKNVTSFCGQIDYALHAAYWGKGLMPEAAARIRDWVKSELPEIKRLQSFCDPRNANSKKVMEKIGMQFEGILRKSFLKKGELVDLAYHSLLL